MTEHRSVRAVVGVDGSMESRLALRWTLDWVAGAGGGRVDAVHVRSWTYAYGPMGAAVAPVDPAALEAEAKRVLDDAIIGVGQVPVGVDLQPLVNEGHPVERLLHLAEQADLLAVGSRGKGGFAGLVLGSVSQQCLHHAPCPVLVVPPPSRHREVAER